MYHFNSALHMMKPIYISILIISLLASCNPATNDKVVTSTASDSTWIAPSLYLEQEPMGDERALLIYGEELIANTSKYLGPKGSVAALTNGMNCQNCHLSSGTLPWGNNFGAVYANYPKFRERSGKVETIFKRVNDCMERSLNGKPLDSNSHEFKAMYAYIKWLGKNVPKGTRPHGSGIEKIPFLNRAADPLKGQLVYISKCQVCHGNDGQGQLLEDGTAYVYPPLWGPHSYNNGAGLFRISLLAGYVRNNMPFNQSSHQNPALSLEEAWDVAAFVNSQPRPDLDKSQDWPDMTKKPFDHPFGPYADGFTAQQHKYGPYQPILAATKK